MNRSLPNRLLLVCVSLLLAFAVALTAGVVAYHWSYTYEYSELTFDNFSLVDGWLYFRVRSNVTGEYVYKFFADDDGNGQIALTFRGGKQPDLAETPGLDDANFKIELPEGTRKLVCGKSTVYTVP